MPSVGAVDTDRRQHGVRLAQGRQELLILHIPHGVPLNGANRHLRAFLKKLETLLVIAVLLVNSGTQLAMSSIAS